MDEDDESAIPSTSIYSTLEENKCGESNGTSSSYIETAPFLDHHHILLLLVHDDYFPCDIGPAWLVFWLLKSPPQEEQP